MEPEEATLDAVTQVGLIVAEFVRLGLDPIEAQRIIFENDQGLLERYKRDNFRNVN